MQVIVGRIGRAHGIKGEVGIDVRTDEPERRFAVGAELTGDARPPRKLTVATSRWHSGRLLVRFAEVPDRTAAEELRNLVLLADVPDDERPEDPEEYYDRDLVGLEVRTPDGAVAGEVVTVVHLPAQDVLEIGKPDGRTVLVPFVADLVPVVEPASGYLVVASRPGLLDPDAAEASDPTDPAVPPPVRSSRRGSAPAGSESRMTSTSSSAPHASASSDDGVDSAAGDRSR